MGETSIEWTDATWNPIRGCSRVSEGCRHCYAESVAGRFSGKGLAYEGLAKRVRVSRPVIQGGAVFDPHGDALKRDEYGNIVVPVGEIVTHEARWTGEVRFVEKHLLDPMKWREPQRIFVNSMSDLFHEKVEDDWIDSIFAVMAWSPRHTFQILTKRPERMRSKMQEIAEMVRAGGWFRNPETDSRWEGRTTKGVAARRGEWPLSNVWLGVSVENQETADERIPLLLDTPAAVRFLSCEPLLGLIDLNATPPIPGHRPVNGATFDDLRGCLPKWQTRPMRAKLSNGVDWVIVGGESGNGARVCETEWIRSIVGQCKTADVACFVKQLGGFPQLRDRGEHEEPFEPHCEWPKGTQFLGGNGPTLVALRSSKGGDMDEWPEYLRVREFPREAVRS